MKINSNWRILTVGDGDCSFSLSLAKHYRPKKLVVSVYDSLQQLTEKYGDSNVRQLINEDIELFTGFDVRNKSSWGKLSEKQFDAVIFQFPLLPNFNSKEAFEKAGGIPVNVLNRQMLRSYLIHCFEHFLDPNGERLAFITSKDVKPYVEWNIEGSLAKACNFNYVGKMAFNISDFPGYKIRNVDRDKHVKDTQGITFVWSDKMDNSLTSSLTIPDYLSDEFCSVCRVGPFMSDKDVLAHQNSKKHQFLQNFENQWLEYINVENNT